MTEASPTAFKRAPSSDTTLDVFGVDVTFLVENEHTGGRFGVLEYVSKPGHEPPPHWHEHEDEVFYVVEGHFEMHCGEQVFQVKAGECIFLPKQKPHGFIIRSPRLRAICVIQPSGAEQALRILGVPKDGGQRRPTGATYASAMRDRANPLKVAAQFGVHILSRDEIAVSLPHFLLPDSQ